MSDGIQPFRIEIPQADVQYLHGRLASALPNGLNWQLRHGDPRAYCTSSNSTSKRSTALGGISEPAPSGP